MWQTESDHYRHKCDEIHQELNELRSELSKITPTGNEIQEALDHHLEQLKRSGATLEDDVCQVLRKSLQAEDLKKKIEKLNEDYKYYWDEYTNAIGG